MFIELIKTEEPKINRVYYVSKIYMNKKDFEEVKSCLSLVDNSQIDLEKRLIWNFRNGTTIVCHIHKVRNHIIDDWKIQYKHKFKETYLGANFEFIESRSFSIPDQVIISDSMGFITEIKDRVIYYTCKIILTK